MLLLGMFVALGVQTCASTKRTLRFCFAGSSSVFPYRQSQRWAFGGWNHQKVHLGSFVQANAAYAYGRLAVLDNEPWRLAVLGGKISLCCDGVSKDASIGRRMTREVRVEGSRREDANLFKYSSDKSSATFLSLRRSNFATNPPSHRNFNIMRASPRLSS